MSAKNGTESNVKNEELVAQLNRIACALEKGQNESEKELSSPLVAAYALNLCLVSVSQIIDYSDIYVLEQEYESILNNLNLEHMPKDEALLDILRQILDTITFFRIQESEKRLIEQEYQERMKNAIWKAVPNFGVIVTSSDPIVILTSLASQVGIGYMNYRKEKTAIAADQERQAWEMQRSAIEQFHGLRRELFTTAWRLADKYEFPDEWRLTEDQVEQYNAILLDTNPYRRLERLEELQDGFIAYPPFWYHKGHTAIEIVNLQLVKLTQHGNHSRVAGEGIETIVIMLEKNRGIARESFEHYFSINNEKTKLLRRDILMSSCALEYVQLLEDNERVKKLEYIEIALKNSGRKTDILQLCAMAFLGIGEREKAAKVLRSLVREGCNVEINAQLLSGLYISNHTDPKTAYADYLSLEEFTDKSLLINWPSEGCSATEQLHLFMREKCQTIVDAYASIVQFYYARKAKEYDALATAEKSEREQAFVMFAAKMEEELSQFPFVSFTHHQFTKALKSDNKQKAIYDWINDRKGIVPFDLLFKTAFKTVFDSVTFESLGDMNQITMAEAKLASLARDCPAMFVEPVDKKVAYLEQFLGRDVKRSQQFKTMLDMIEKSNLIVDSKGKIELLLAGSSRYDRYISEHNLWDEEVTAILNDTSMDDVDLIFTVHGILVQKKQSKLWKTIRDITASAKMPGMPKPLALVMLGAGLFAISLSGYVTRYDEIEFSPKKDALAKPQYKNKNVNMKALCTLLTKMKEHQVAIEGGGAWLNQRIRAKAEIGLLAGPEQVDCIE